MEDTLNQAEMAELLAEARKLLSEHGQLNVGAPAQPVMPTAGSLDLDRRLAQIQSGQFEPSDLHRADGLTMAPAGYAVPQAQYQQMLPKRPELTKTDYFGTLAAIGIIGVFAVSGVGIVASLLVMLGKSSESASYRDTIAKLVEDNKELSDKAVKAAQDGKPRCYGLFVSSCGENQPVPAAPPVVQPIVSAPETPAPQVSVATLVCESNAIATATPINIRAGVGVEHDVKGQAPCGGVVNVLEYRPDWSLVQAGEVQGFMKSSFLGGM